MHLQKIILSAERMSILIKDILNFSSLNREINFIPTNLNNVLSNVLEDIDLTIEQKNARIEFETLPTIDAFPLQINQLFFNLIINALKFTLQDIAPVITIKVRVLTETELVQHPHLNKKVRYYKIVFADNGIGFSPEFSKQIFGLFKRLYNQQLYPGSGIGLALCNKIVINHHGEIFAHSSEGKGASFHIILPEAQ